MKINQNKILDVETTSHQKNKYINLSNILAANYLKRLIKLTFSSNKGSKIFNFKLYNIQ